MSNKLVFAAVFFLLLALGGLQAERSLKPLPDLVVPAIDFKKVSQQQDALGHKYWIFNVYVTLANQGKADAGPFQMLLVRNVGPNHTFVQACQTCHPAVKGLAAGQSIILGPFQFNNADNAGCAFNAKADYPDHVTESNELNNIRTATFVE